MTIFNLRQEKIQIIPTDRLGCRDVGTLGRCTVMPSGISPLWANKSMHSISDIDPNLVGVADGLANNAKTLKNPMDYLVGFTEADGCFSISIQKIATGHLRFTPVFS